MTRQEKQAYFDAIYKRYRKATRVDKGKILDEFCAICHYQRKYAIRKLNQSPTKRNKRKPGRRTVYQHPEILSVIKAIWFATVQMCGKRLVAAIPLWLPHYESFYQPLAPHIKQKVLSASAATLDRLLHPLKAHYKGGFSGTKPGTLLKNHIPIRTDNWDITQPGYMEADTVAHCGNSLVGDFVWSLTLTDILTEWTECRATWNKGSVGVIKQIKAIEQALPFMLRGFDCDNGSEFLNYHLWRYFTEHPNQPQFTRSRPYKKNDNAHVEQKNWTHVRHLFGYDRFENQGMVELMNDLYANEWSLYQNHFCPTMKLQSKHRIGARYIKKYEQAQTPYERVINCDAINQNIKQELKIIHEGMNPFVLKQRIELKLKEIFSHVSVTSNVRQRI
jgi:hypothetical protein